MLPNLSGDYKVMIQAYNYSITTPYITEMLESDVLRVTVDDNPQAPEKAVPTDIDFTDTDGTHFVIAGSVTFNEASNYTIDLDNRQFEYYLIWLSTQPECDTNFDNPNNMDDVTCTAGTGRDTSNDDRLGVVTYTPGPQSFNISGVTVPDATPNAYIHVTAYETAGLGAETRTTATHAVIDVQRDDAATIVVPESGGSIGFYDKDGSNRVIQGVIDFFVDSGNYSDIGTFEVYLHEYPTFEDSSELGPRVASVINPGNLTTTDRVTIWLQTFDNVYATPDADPGVPTALDVGDKHYSHLLVLSRTASDINEDGVELGEVLSASAAAVEIDDRVDSYYFLNHLSSNTGGCPAGFCPGGSPTAGSMYWPFAEQAEGSSGEVTIYWLTASLDHTLYELDDSASARAIELLDNTALDDMSALFTYSVALGGVTDDPACVLSATATWPHGAPDNWQTIADMTNRELFYLQTDYAGLLACGFTEATTKADISLEGMLTLTLNSVARTDAVGSTTSPTEAEITIQAGVAVTFSDETHAVIGSVSVDNVLVVLDSVSADVTVMSEVSFYEEAFLAPLDASTKVFIAGTDQFHVEHSLTTNEDSFYIDLQRMWFSSGGALSNSVEYLVPQSDQAYANVDSPALPGRFRSITDVPYLMNCKPCFLHVVSSIDNDAPVTKSLSDKESPDSTTSAHEVFVDSSVATEFTPSSAECNKLAMFGSVAALVMARA
jgi:hypothetical protein